jgi:pimeloyl-ACP methyl ester carboxylesterase
MKMMLLVYLLLTLVAGLIIVSLVAPRPFCLGLFKLARLLCGYQAKTVTVDGYQWHYLDSGDEAKEVLVLVHGFGANKDNWLTYGRLFNKRYRVIVPDLPGFGDNLKDTSLSYNVKLQADRLQAFLLQLGLGRVHLTGNSMGGFIATQFALSYPEQLRSVILMNAAGVEGTRKSWLEQHVDKGENPLVVKTPAQMDELFARVAHRPMKLPAIIKNFMLEDMVANHDFYDSIFWELLSKEGGMDFLNDQLSQINMPVMIIWGEHDQLLDVSCAHVIKEKLPTATLVVLDDVGHIPMVEAPKLTARHQLAFLAGLPAQAR